MKALHLCPACLRKIQFILAFVRVLPQCLSAVVGWEAGLEVGCGCTDLHLFNDDFVGLAYSSLFSCPSQ